MTKPANNKSNEFKNIWQKNGIPTLEYCSIERAIQLLDCKRSDIIHWLLTEKIRFAVYIEEPISTEFTAIETINDNEPIVLDRFSVPEGGFTRVQIESKDIFDELRDINGLNIITKGKCKIDKVCFPTPSIELNNGKLITTPIKRFFVKLSSGRFYMECVIEDSLEFQENDIVIIAEDIERIFISGKEGNTLSRPILFKNPIAEVKEIKEKRETVHQADMIFSLLNLIGITVEEVAENPEGINRKLRDMASRKGVTCRQPDPKTWIRWADKVKR